MLLVRTYLARSTIEGIGCFARHNFRKGTKVWRFHPPLDLVLDAAQAAAVFDREFFERYGQRCSTTAEWLLPADNARFINHSAEPNLHTFSSKWGDLDAACDIGAGEELTCDYRICDGDPWAGFGERQRQMMRLTSMGDSKG